MTNADEIQSVQLSRPLYALLSSGSPYAMYLRPKGTTDIALPLFTTRENADLFASRIGNVDVIELTGWTDILGFVKSPPSPCPDKPTDIGTILLDRVDARLGGVPMNRDMFIAQLESIID